MMTDKKPRAAEHSCRYCPMCHHADLTVTLQRRETYSARGRGLAVFAAEQGALTSDAEFADVMYSFFADGLCRHVCAGHIAHDEMVIGARRRLVAEGRAPAAVARVKANIEKTGNPWGESEPDLVALTGASPQKEVLVYFGPAARIQRPKSVSALASLLTAAEVHFSVLRQEPDSGLLLYQLGESEAATAVAQTLGRSILESGARTVVTSDAEAYRTLKVGFGDVPPLSAVEVRHTSELLVDLMERFPIRRPVHSPVVYHDPCALARFSPCLEAPRVLLKKICGVTPREMGPWSRELAHCSGECGGVPFTRPLLAREAAEHRVKVAREVGAEVLVAGSPAAAAALDGYGLEIQDLSEFLADRLQQ